MGMLIDKFLFLGVLGYELYLFSYYVGWYIWIDFFGVD